MLSRVADSLYWMGRYIERAEHTSRLLAVRLESMVEQSKEDADRAWARMAAALSAEEFAPQFASTLRPVLVSILVPRGGAAR